MKFKKVFMMGIFLMLIMLCIASASASASASDVNDTTLKTSTDTIKLSDFNGPATDNNQTINADDEIIGVSSENENNSVNKNIIASSQSNDKLGNESPRTFTQLRDDILATEGNVFNMQYNYKYNNIADMNLRVNDASRPWITKQVTINGNGYSIDGSKYNGNFYFTNVLCFNDVTIKNFKLLTSDTNINFTNCNFTEEISIYGSYIRKNFINCNFFNITTEHMCISYARDIINCTFKNIVDDIEFINQVFNITNCYFENILCKPDYETPMIAFRINNEDHQTYIKNSIIKNCSAPVIIQGLQNSQYSAKGRVHVINCTFINNTAYTTLFGLRSKAAYNFYGAVLVNDSKIYLNKRTIIFNSRSEYCNAFNNTIIGGHYTFDSDVEDSIINFTYSGLSSSVYSSRADLVTSKFDRDECFVYVNGLPQFYQRFNLVVKDINGSVVLNGSVVSDINGQGSFDCSKLGIGNYTYTIYHNTYHTVSNSGLLSIEGYPELVINSITIGYGQKYYNITGAFKFGSRTSGMASTLNLSTSSGIRLGSAVVNDDGTWTVTNINSTLLLPGIYDLHGDYAGNANHRNFSNTTGNLTVTIGNFEPLLYNVDIEFGDDKILNITLQNGAGETFSGFVINLTGKSINGILSKTTDADGKVSFNISDLAVGDYNWNISTTGIAGLYNPLNMSIGTFKVKRAYGWNITPYLNATVIVYGDNVSVIGGVINKHLASPTGIITLTDGLKSDSYTLTVDDKGNFKLTLVNVTSGLKNFTIQYSGDANYSGMNYTILKEVDKFPITLNITSIAPLDTTYPDSIIVRGNILYPDYLPAPTGILTLTLGDKTVTAVLDGGNFTATFVGVKPGNYTNITLSFTPQTNLNYTGTNSSINISTVSIDKFLPQIIAVSNVIQSYPGIVNVVGTIVGINGQNPTGKIEIIYNNTVYAVYNLTTADNGAFNINVLNLPVGEYNLTVRYAGDDYYCNNTNTTNIFTVNPSGVKFNITIINGTYNMGGVSSRFIVNVTGVNGGDKTPEGIVRITLSDGSRSWQAVLNNGIANVGITSLDAGNYTNVKVEYIKSSTEDHYLNNESTGHKFSIYKADPGLQVEAPTIGFGADGKIYIEIADDATGNVTVKIGLVDTVTFELASGVRVYTIPKPNPGSYNITATYNGDKNYNSSVAKTTFFIERPNAFLHINSSNIQYGEVEIVNFTIFGDDTLAQIADNARGTIMVYGLSKNPYILNVVNGRASLPLANLAIGEYNIVAIYSGDDELAGSYQADSFNVTGADTGLIIITNSPINEGEDLLVDVYVNHSINDLIYLYLGDGMYAANMTEDGKFSFIIPNLKQGTYLLNASFKGNAKFNAVWNTTTVIVKKQINASVITNNSGDKLHITMPDNVTGNVTVSFNGTNYTVGIVNGSALINLTNATPGDHNVTITYTDADGNNITTNITVTIPKWDSTIDLNVTNINEGDKEIIQVGVTPGATGEVIIKVNDIKYLVDLVDSKAELILDNLREGNYTVTATYTGDKYYKNSTISKMFKVTKLVVDVNTTGNSSSLDVKVPGNTTGNATVNINSTNYTAEIVNGTAKINLTNATPGTYNATITYTDENGTKITTNITITVPKWDSTIDLNVTNIYVGETEVIQVSVTPGTTGHVYITVDNLTYYKELINSKATLNIKGLDIGNYTVSVYYSGDDYYKNSSAFGWFNVSSTGINVNTTNSTDLNITFPANTTGNVTVIINGQNYTGAIVNGSAVVDLSNATPGTYNATVIYTDKDGNQVKTTMTMSVPKWNTLIDLNVTDIYFGSDETIIVNVTKGATGFVIIDVNGTVYYKELSDSKTSIVLEGLKVGNYTVVATYLGDKYYNNATIAKIFEVKTSGIVVNNTENSTDLNITVPDNVTGNVTVILDGKNYTGVIVNGSAVVDLSNATPGTYNATVIYNDENGKQVNTSMIIAVPKWDALIDLNVTDIYFGSDETIIVNVTKGATGFVIIDVNGTVYYKELNDSKTSIVLKGLSVGNYTVVATYLGDKYYNNATIAKIFEVKTSGIVVNNTENSTDLNITVPDNVTGNVTVILDGKNYTGVIVNGSAVVDLSNATPGTYNATVIYTDKDGKQVNTSMIIAVPKWDALIDLNVTDIYFGSDETIIVNVTKGATGFVIIDVNGTVYYKQLSDSKTSIVLKGLSVGNYTVVATYLGDKYYNNATIAKIFEVKTSGIVVNNTENSTDLNITVPDNVTGNVTVILDGKNYTGVIVNGSAVVDLSNAAPGTYNATVIYTDKDGKQVNTSMIIAVPKWDALIDLNVTDIYFGSDETIIVNVTKGATGFVIIDVNGTVYYKELNDSKTSIVLKGLKVGNYTVVATYLGDKYYNNATIAKIFEVKTSGIIVNNTENSTDLNITVPDNVTGNVTVILDGKNYTGVIVNGSAVVDLSNATPGTYNATVIYNDENGKQVNTSMIIAVPKWNSSVDIAVSDIRGGQRETIIINVTNGATGNVLIDVNGVIYYKELINSKTTLELDNLAKGAYTVRVTYMGDDKYNNSTNQDNFVVGEGVVLTVYLDGKNPMLDVAVPHDAVGDVTVRINGKDYTGLINNHHAILNISDIAPGMYNATSTYKIGNGTVYANNDTITVPEQILLATVINVEHISRDMLVTSVLKDVNGTVLPFQFITYKLNGVIANTTTDKDGLFTVQCVQNSTLYIEYAGNKVYEGCNATIVLDKFLDIRNATQIISEVYTTYAVDFALGERGGYFKFQIKDENGKALANKPVQIGFCGVVYNRVTDDDGYAQLQINLNTPFIFTFAIAFLGDETHNASFVVQQINVNKKTTTLQANAKTFKASAKTKAYTVTLKSNVGSSIDGKSYMGAGKKITMKVNGKTYTANTKANGEATFKLDLTKKGTYNASISFGGDQRYDVSKTTAKIKIN